MKNLFTAPKTDSATKLSPALSWKDSVGVQKTLDAICQILAEEYCHIAKENPQIFTTKG